MAECCNTCRLCGAEFNGIYNRPKRLPCSHVVCKKCLQTQIVDTGDFLICPQCDSNVTKQDLIAITTDFAMLELCLKHVRTDEASASGVEEASPCSTADDDSLQCDHSTSQMISRQNLNKKFDEAMSQSEMVCTCTYKLYFLSHFFIAFAANALVI